MTKRPFSPMNSKPYRNRPAVHIIIRVGDVGISYIGRSKPHIYTDTKSTHDAVCILFDGCGNAFASKSCCTCLCDLPVH